MLVTTELISNIFWHFSQSKFPFSITLRKLTYKNKHTTIQTKTTPYYPLGDVMYRYADMYCNYVFLFSTQVAYLCKPEEIKSLNLNLANSADDKLMIFLNFYPKYQDSTIHANSLHWRQSVLNVKSCFLGKIRKIFQDVFLLKILPRVLSVKISLFFPENRIWHFMQTISNKHNLHEMQNLVLWEEIRKLSSICHILKILPSMLSVKLAIKQFIYQYKNRVVTVLKAMFNILCNYSYN